MLQNNDMLRVLTFAVPAWTTMLTKCEINQIESILKVGLYLVYGQRYISYEWALSEARMLSLESQRNTILTKFTKKCINSDKFSKWFSLNDNTNLGVNTRSVKDKYRSVTARTLAYKKSPLPQITVLANSIS